MKLTIPKVTVKPPTTTIAVRIAPSSSRPHGRSSAPASAALSIVGTATLAASRSTRPASMTSEKRFWATQPRHSTW